MHGNVMLKITQFDGGLHVYKKGGIRKDAAFGGWEKTLEVFFSAERLLCRDQSAYSATEKN